MHICYKKCMTNKKKFEELGDIIKREERLRELVGKEKFQELSSQEKEDVRLFDLLAEILVDIFLEWEKGKE